MSFDVTSRLDYLQRVPGSSPRIEPLQVPEGPPHRSVARVRSIGSEREGEGLLVPESKNQRVESERFVTAAFMQRTPLVCSFGNADGGFSATVGSWSSSALSSAQVRLNTLKSSLTMLYPAIRIESCGSSAPELAGCTKGGYVLGIPSYARSASAAAPIDDLIRGLAGASWNVTIVAEPVALETLEALRGELLVDMIDASALQHYQGAPNPLAVHFLDLNKQMLDMYALAMTQGAWRVAVYLSGNEESYPQLAASWGGLYAGEQSTAQPLRIYDDDKSVTAAKTWALSNTPYPSSATNSGFRHHLMHQTILSSSALAYYCQLPKRETAGLRRFIIPRLDLEPLVPKTKSPLFGRVVRHPEEIVEEQGLKSSVYIDVNNLTSHALVVGTTGSGKTTTLYAILRATADAGIPFLIVEPAKHEYRRLIQRNWKKQRPLRVFTLGDENTAPLPINPFEPAHTKVSVLTHIDLLKSAFTASFGMWSPLPQILERALIEIYIDLGWDITTGQNRRCVAGEVVPIDAWPTLEELRDKVDSVVTSLGYDQKIADDMRAALVTRISSLCLGAKGRMLNTRTSVSMEALLSDSVILELESLGDDDDKAFVIGIIMIRLYEYLRGQGERASLKHLLVIEEAHRLLKQAESTGRSEDASPRAKAVETFANMLAEIRAYGEGIIVVDQSPSILAPSVIKNTNLKIVQRIVSLEDRKVMAGAMSMTEEESAIMANLPPGFAVQFSAGDDRPLLVRIEDLKSQNEEGQKQVGWLSSTQIQEHNAKQLPPLTTVYAPDFHIQDRVKAIANDRFLQHQMEMFALTLLIPEIPPEESQLVLTDRVKTLLYTYESLEVLLDPILLQAASKFIARATAIRGVNFSETHTLSDALAAVISSRNDREKRKFHGSIDRFRSLYLSVLTRQHDPYPACSLVCPPTLGTKYCLYREVASKKLRRSDKFPESEDQENALLVSSQQYANDVMPSHPDEALNPKLALALCRTQQMLEGAPSTLVVELIGRILQKVSYDK